MEYEDPIVTFYNDEEGWEFTSPLIPLLKNEVLAAMLTGQFRESNTKRICLSGFEKSVVQQFVFDLTTGANYEQKFLDHPNNSALFNIRLTRLAHQFNQKDLFERYLQQTTQTFEYGGGQQYKKEVYYELMKLVVDLSLVNHQNLLSYCVHKLDLMFELDDHILLKALCPFMQRHGGTQAWIQQAIQYKGWKCLKVIFEEGRGLIEQHALQVIRSDIILPDDLLKFMFTKYRVDRYENMMGNIRQSSSRINLLGALLRLFPEDFHIWHQVFEAGFLEVVKFAPKSILAQNNGQNSFGTTAITKGWFKCLELILSAGWDPKPTNALTLATVHANPKLIQTLLEHGAVPDDETVNRVTEFYQRSIAKSVPALLCVDLIEAATLANVLESKIYQAYSSKPVEYT